MAFFRLLPVNFRFKNAWKYQSRIILLLARLLRWLYNSNLLYFSFFSLVCFLWIFENRAHDFSHDRKSCARFFARSCAKKKIVHDRARSCTISHDHDRDFEPWFNSARSPQPSWRYRRFCWNFMKIFFNTILIYIIRVYFVGEIYFHFLKYLMKLKILGLKMFRIK